jgi:uncharacterized protein
MARLFFFLALGFGIVWLLRRWHRGPAVPPPHAESPSEPDAAVATMVVCAHCGVLLPDNEAIVDGTLSYCTPEHQARGPARS